jgi:hypothetical protein
MLVVLTFIFKSTKLNVALCEQSNLCKQPHNYNAIFRLYLLNFTQKVKIRANAQMEEAP